MLGLLNALFGLDGVIYTAALTDMISILIGGLLCFYQNRNVCAVVSEREKQDETN